jgi:xanthine dehydrogenase YagT iron-sulfur-binding subunit
MSSPEATALATVRLTVNGVERELGGELHPLQEAFVAHDAFQCGYCTSGQLCSAVGTLAEVRRG